MANGGEGVLASARRDEVIVLQGFWRRRLIARIRAANPDCNILIYQNLSRTAVPQLLGRYNTAITRADAKARGWESGVRDDQESWLHFVEPNDAAGYARFALRRMATKLKKAARAGQPVDGIFLDDVNSFAPSAVGGDPTSSAAEWNGWMTQVNAIVGPGLQKLGYKVMANLSGSIAARNLESGGWEERQFRYFTYVFDEHFAYWADGTPQLQLFVDEAFRLASVARRAGTVYVASVPDGGDEAKATFGLAMLLIQSPGRAAKAPGRGDGEPWHPVYDRARGLGRPVRPRVSPSPGVWTRRFEGGSVRVDLRNRTATIR
ncbi:MAG TPA: putative glycoside hydrolase [Thermoleophilaceae bacterium]